jgi:hypothetical protein
LQVLVGLPRRLVVEKQGDEWLYWKNSDETGFVVESLVDETGKAL